ncbi:type 2 lanthipeptide synthetase LanM [Microbispora rosea]|uniref:type 2 lanthipeptide synthetase LanM n=1 Tax=Microbispora rosea TaxID=58117 RepID=UPI00341BC780
MRKTAVLDHDESRTYMTLVSEDLFEGLVRDCVDLKAATFGGFYRPFLAECAARIGRWQDRWDAEQADAVDVPGVADTLLRAVMDLCSGVGVRTLITLFRGEHEERGTGYAQFHERISGAEGRAEVLGRFPELDRLLRLVVTRYVDHAEDVLRTAWRERHLLAEHFGTRGPVTGIVPGLGDSHCGGRTVCQVHWDDVRLIYKPHRRNCQDLLAALRSLVDEDGSFFGPLHPKTIVRPGHLWQERVEHADVGDAEGQAGYFRRFGRVSALLTMIGVNDLHHENVIAASQGPVVIDTETLVSLPGRTATGVAAALVDDVETSVLNTMLFPTRFKNEVLDIDLSAIGSVDRGQSRSLRTFTVVDAGTDAIRFDHLPVGVEPGPSMASAEGEPIDPRMWADEITAGFREAWERLYRNRDSIMDTVTRSGGWAIRHILRGSYVYGRFIEASTHPAYLSGTEDRAALLRRIPHNHRGVGGQFAQALTHEEVHAMLDLDVPYFDVECDSRDLRCNGRSGVGDAVRATPRQALLTSIARFFERPPGRDLTYIRYSLLSSVDDVWESRVSQESRTPVSRGRTPARTGPPAGALTDTARWHESLRDLVVGGPDRPTWLQPQLDDRGLRMGPVNAVLYEGGGLLVYLAQVEALGKETAGIDAGSAFAAITEEIALFRVPTAVTSPLWVSPFTGTFSNAVTGLELRRRGGSPSVGLPDPMVTAAPHFDAGRMSAEDLDYLNGYGGHLLYLAEYADDNAPRIPGLDEERVLRRLIEIDGPPEEHSGDLGLAHGRSGRIAAMSALTARGPHGHAREHLERYASGYLRNRWTDAGLRDAAGGSGWCKGYSGVAFALAKLLRAVGYPADQVREAITPEVERIIDGDLGSDVSFCHGIAGRLAMLCWLADRLAWPELRAEAASLSAAFVERYGDGGWSCGIGTSRDLPLFLLGLPGWHYAQLMLAHPGVVELPLCLGGR